MLIITADFREAAGERLFEPLKSLLACLTREKLSPVVSQCIMQCGRVTANLVADSGKLDRIECS